MKKLTINNLFKGSLTLALIAVFNISNAQFFSMQSVPEEYSYFGVKGYSSNFKKNEYINHKFTGILNLYGNINLNEKLRLNVELPFVINRTEYSYFDITEKNKASGIGNIYLGLQKVINESQTSNIAFGLYLPTIGQRKYEKQEVGISGNSYHIFQYAEAVTLYLNLAHHNQTDKGWIYGVEAGPELGVPTGEGHNESELSLHYAAKGGFNFDGALALWAEFTGIWLATEKDAQEYGRINQLTLGTQLFPGKINPGIFYSVNIEKYNRDYVNGVFGLKVDFKL